MLGDKLQIFKKASDLNLFRPGKPKYVGLVANGTRFWRVATGVKKDHSRTSRKWHWTIEETHWFKISLLGPRLYWGKINMNLHLCTKHFCTIVIKNKQIREASSAQEGYFVPQYHRVAFEELNFSKWGRAIMNLSFGKRLLTRLDCLKIHFERTDSKKKKEALSPKSSRHSETSFSDNKKL